MQEDSDQDPSFSLGSEIGENSQSAQREDGSQNLNALEGIQQGWSFTKQFPIHGRLIPPSRFPFHLYLKQRYQRLSLQQQIRIFQFYFKCDQNVEQRNKVNQTHIEILNDGLNLYTKVPENPLLFLFIKSYNHTSQLVILKNYNGEIVNFQILDKNRKRSTTIFEIKRKVKGRPFIIIYDCTPQGLESVNKKFLIKITKGMKFVYIKVIPDNILLGILRNEFFAESDQRFIEYGDKRRVFVSLDQPNKTFYAYSKDCYEVISKQQVLSLLNQYITHFKYLIGQQQKLIKESTCFNVWNFRLLTFDALFINFIKSTGTTKQQFIHIIQKMSDKYANVNLNIVEENRDHYAERLLNSRRCKYCEIIGLGRNKKSKFKCLACSKKFQADIPLCIDCFGDFHYPNVKDMRRQYEAHRNKKIRKAQRMGSKAHSLLEKYENNQEAKLMIYKMNDSMTEIEKLIQELEAQSYLGIKIAKKFNEVLFLNIIENLNAIGCKFYQEQGIYPHAFPQKPPSGAQNQNLPIESDEKYNNNHDPINPPNGTKNENSPSFSSDSF